MLLAKPFFATFTDKPVANAHQSTEVLNCIGCESREQVDRLVTLAQRHGGKAHREAKDLGAMYGHGFEDPDGHIWELVHMSAQQDEA
jgi:predicted lactoylglutathione lyase